MADDLREETAAALHDIAEAEGVQGHSKLVKDDLVAAIEDNRRGLRPPAQAGAAAVAEYESEADEPTVPVERLIDEAEAFLDCPRYVAAGALSGVSTKNLTPGQGKAAVEAFLGAQVSTDPVVAE
jgi:hypothetical protein